MRGKLAAVIIEPMQGGAGALPATAAFIAALREATERHGVLLIFDEVMTSRVHFGGLQAHFGVKPDLVTLGKYIAGGLTIGAFGGRADIMRRFDPSRPGAFPHGGTFNNNVVAMAAGYVALTRILTREATDRMNALGDRLRAKLNGLASKHALPMVATGFGSIFGIHFHEGAIAQYRRSGSWRSRPRERSGRPQEAVSSRYDCQRHIHLAPHHGKSVA